MMRCYHGNLTDTTFKYPSSGFWIVHVLGSLLLIALGFRIAVKRIPLPIIAYRLIKSLR